MSDKIVEVTRKSYFSRIGESFKGIISGIILILISVVLLFWNEGRAVKTAKTLKEGAASVVTVPSDVVNPSNEGRLVHTIGTASTEDLLIDDEFEISRNVLRLQRKVEMYQWTENKSTEERKKLGGGTEEITTYEYNKVWSESLINSSNFKEEAGHQNPSSIPFKSQILTANKGKLGAFSLTSDLIAKLNSFRDVSITDSELQKIKNLPRFQNRIHRMENGFYIGTDPSQPQIGDLRIYFSEVPIMPVSIIGSQIGGSFTQYQTEAGGEILMIEPGNLPAKNMFAAAENKNTMLTWILRGLGLLLSWIGFGLILKPLSVLADLIPLLGNILETATSVLSLIIALPLSILVIAAAWFFFRPILSIILFIIAAAVLIGGVILLKKKNQSKIQTS